jgi:hypothetical protein
MLWNALKPERYPESIVSAASEADVVAAVDLARSRGLQVALRAGGHSWVGSPLRDGTLLIDPPVASRAERASERAVRDTRCGRARGSRRTRRETPGSLGLQQSAPARPALLSLVQLSSEYLGHAAASYQRERGRETNGPVPESTVVVVSATGNPDCIST